MLSRHRTENFPVASRLLPGAWRADLMALYGYARLTDELGDSYAGDRLAALGWLESATRRALAGYRSGHELIDRAADVVTRRALAADPLFELIEANRLDQQVRSYATFDDLVAYCRLSANPVGRLVLGVFGVDGAAMGQWSDSICTGLQLVEHCQDVVEDANAGRVYLPAEDLERFGTDASVLTRHPWPAQLRAVVALQAARARRYLEAGRPLIDHLGGRPGLAVAAFYAGGQAVLDALADVRFDVSGGAPKPNARRLGVHLVRVLRAGPGRPAAA